MTAIGGMKWFTHIAGIVLGHLGNEGEIRAKKVADIFAKWLLGHNSSWLYFYPPGKASAAFNYPTGN